MTNQPRDLQKIQRWMQAVIMHPDGIVGGINSAVARAQIDVSSDEVDRVITRSQALNSVKRLEVYGNAYYARLLEVLRGEFPALQHAAGQEAFDGFAFGYLQSSPSHSYTLAALSGRFPQYMEETRPTRKTSEEGPDWPDFLIDLARLERAYSDVFDGPGPERGELLKSDELSDIPQECWPDVTLVPVACLRLMTFRFPVHEYASAVRNAEGEGPAPPNPQQTYLAINRRDYVVRRRALSFVQYELLRAIVEGSTLADAIARAVEATDTDVETLARQFGDWFQVWTAAQFFQAVELPDQAT